MTGALPLTGERTVPGIPQENYWFRRHEVVYESLAPRCVGRFVLEAGCGEGYGADLLCRSPARVLALDYDAHTTGHVARRYPHLPVVRGNLANLPLRSSSVDVVLTLQVIEHLWDQPKFLRECHRVLAPGGELLVSTPNRLTFSPGRDIPLNPFHTRELTGDELTGLLAAAGFTVTNMAGLRHGARLRALDAEHDGSVVDAQVAASLAGLPWPDRLRSDVEAVTCADFALSTADIDSSLDLVAIGVRW